MQTILRKVRPGPAPGPVRHILRRPQQQQPPPPTTSPLLRRSFHRTPPRQVGPRSPFPGQKRYGDARYEERLRAAEPLFNRAWWASVARSRRVRWAAAILAASAAAFYVAHLETVPVTGRTRFNYYRDGWLEDVADMETRRILWTLERQGARLLPAGDPRVVMVRRVMRRLVPYSGLGAGRWPHEVRVIDDPGTANAFVLPNGAVFVHSGLFRVTGSDEDLVATVLGHEAAHRVASHQAEQASRDLWAFAALPLGLFGFWAADILFSRPMGRLQESEADYIGLMIMAEACYDPRRAAELWRRMDLYEKQLAGAEVPEWLSTHPLNKDRLSQIQAWTPEALEKRANSDCQGTTAYADSFRRALHRGGWLVV